MNVNRVGAGLVAAFALAAFAATFAFDPVPPGLPGLGAAEVPRLICGVILVLAAMLVVAKPSPPDPDAVAPDAGAWAIWACCAAFLPAMAVFGMLGASALFLVVAGRVWGERRWALLVGVSLTVTVSLWVVFVKVFRLTLPGGMIG